MGLPNPLEIIENIGKLAQASKIASEVQKIDNVDIDGQPIPDGNPDVEQFFTACRKLLSDLDAINKTAALIMRLQANLVGEISQRLSEIGKDKGKE